MLDAKKNRLDYGYLLTPEKGYTLDFAISTTYSLDLNTLIEVLLPLGLLEESDNREVYDKIFILRALKKMANKLVVFVDSSQIKIPRDFKARSLTLLLEKMILPVNTEIKGCVPSFHPKCWILKYVNEYNAPIYKLIVLSRNLTNDRSWDTAISFAGKPVKNKVMTKNQEAITDFIDYLLEQLHKQQNILNNDDALNEVYIEKQRKIESLREELKYVKFELPEGNDFEIIPVGIGEEYSHISEGQLFSGKKQKLTVMSPFISMPVVRNFEKLVLDSEKITFITRLQELAKIKTIVSLPKTDLYIIRQEASVEKYLQNDNLEEDEFEEDQLQDIHAKIYVEETETETNLYLGSVNASSFAQKHNVEMAVKISFEKKEYCVDDFLNELACGDWKDTIINPFRKVTESDFTTANNLESEDQNLTIILKKICRCKAFAEVTEENEDWRLNIFFEDVLSCINKGYRVNISPLGNPAKSCEITNDSVRIEGIKISQISQLYKIHIENIEDKQKKLEKTIIIPTKFSIEDRDNALEQSIFETKDDFCRYLSLLLDDDVKATLREINSLKKNGLLTSYSSSSGSIALYERLLKNSLNKSDFDNTIHEIDSLIQTIGDKKTEIVPEEVEQIVKIFRNVAEL